MSTVSVQGCSQLWYRTAAIRDATDCWACCNAVTRAAQTLILYHACINTGVSIRDHQTPSLAQGRAFSVGVACSHTDDK